MGATAAIIAAAEAVKAVCTLLATPEGQSVMKSWRESSDAWNKAIGDAATWFKGALNEK